MPDLFEKLKDLQDRRSIPIKQGGLGNYNLPDVLPTTGYDPAAGESSVIDMPTRSRYDKGIMEGQNVDDYRSTNQGGLALTGAFVGRVLGTGLAKVAEGFSVLGSAVGAGVAGIVDATGLDNLFGTEMDDKHHSLDRIINNPINKIFFDLEDKIKEVMPVYHDSKWGERSVSDKFFNNFGEWMADQGADGVAFALSALIPGAAASKIGLGAAILGDASRGATALARVLAEAGASEKVLAGASKAIDWATQYGVQTSGEALFEAKDTGDQMTQKYLQSLNANRPPSMQYKSINDLPPNLQADAKAKIAGAMKNDYWWNMIALAPSNIFEMGLLNKFMGKVESTAVRGIGAEINAGENIAEEAAKSSAEAFQGIGTGKFKKLSKSIYDAGERIGSTRLGAAAKVIPEAIASEGLYEENIQNQIQDMSMQYGLAGKSGYFLESGFGAAKQALEAITPSHLNDPKYKDTRESIFAGALIGALFGGAAGATSEFNHERSEKQAREQAKDNAINFLNSAKSDFLKQDLYQTVDVKQEDGTTKKEIQYDNEGNPVVNKAAVTNFLGNQKRMADLVASEEYFTVTGQQEMAKIVRDERTTNWALSHLQSGKADAMFVKLDNLAQAKDGDLQKLGFDPSYYGENGKGIPVVERVEKLRQKAAQVKSHYDDAIRSVPIEQTARIEELVRLKSRMDSMNEQIDSLEAQKQKVALEYRNDPDHVRQIDQETRRLRALEENKNYLDNRRKALEDNQSMLEEQAKHIDTADNAKELQDSLKRIRDAHGVDRSRIEAAQNFHDTAITESKNKIDRLKETFKDPLEQAGYNSTPGEYKLLKNAGAVNNGKRYAGQTRDIADADKRIVQLQGAIAEHDAEYNELRKPFDGAIHYQNRLRSVFNQQDVDSSIEDNRVQSNELPRSQFEPTPQAPIIQGNQVVQLAPTTPEVVSTDPTQIATTDMTLPETNANQAQVVKEAVTTGGRLDTTKLAKFASDNLGKTVKVTYNTPNGDRSVYGTIRLNEAGQPAFHQDNGQIFPVERLAGQDIKEIVPLSRQPQPVVRTEEAPTPKESKIVDKPKAQEFDKALFSSAKPYLAVGLNSTTGLDNSNEESQERWFRATENLDLNNGKYQLLTVTSKNQAEAKKVLGDNWSDKLLYDEGTIKAVLLRNGEPVKADQFGNQTNDGDLVYSSLPLTPSKDKIGVIEYRNYADLRASGLSNEYTHQNDPNARFIATKAEIENGTVDRLLAAHKEWRDTVLSDPNTKIIDITSKGSGVRVKADLGAVQGRLTEGQTVDVKIATGETISDPSGKSITVRPGLTYTEYKNMVVPLTGRNLTKSEQVVVKDVLSRWSQLASQGTRLSQQIAEETNEERLTDLSNQLQSIVEERNALKQYLEDTIRFGDTDVNGIYIENGLFKFKGQELAQEDLWSDTNTEGLDAFLADKYLQISSRALNDTNSKYTEYTANGERVWDNYNTYLTSSEYPDETPRAESDIPLRTSLAPIGEAQFRSVNLRYNGITDAVKPVRNDTAAANKAAPNTQVADKTTNRKELSLQAISNIASGMEEGKTYRVEMRLRDRSQGQEPFYLDYKVVNGQKEFVQITKRDGTTSTVEPKSMAIYREELNNPETITERPSDFQSQEIMDIKELTPTIPTTTGEQVELAPRAILADESPFINKVLDAFNGEFTGDRAQLQEFVDGVTEQFPNETPEDIAKSYKTQYPEDIAPKSPKPIVPRRTFRGMTSDGRIAKPINIEKEMAWFKERFPNVDIQRVNGLIQGKYWGLFDTAAGVLLSTDAVEGTAYHEAFHTASLLYNNESERQAVYKEYRDRTDFKGTDAEVEEQLADAFRDYVIADGKYTLPEKQQSFFRKLWEAIKNLFTGNNSQRIEDLFNKINSSGFANQEVSQELGLQTVAPKIADTAETYTRTHALLEDMTVSFFDHFFADGHNINTLFNVYSAGKQSILTEGIYEKMLEDYKQRVQDNTQYGLEGGGLISSLLREGAWEEMVALHKQELANLGLKIIDKTTSDGASAEENNDTNLELDGQKDNAQMESHIEFSSKEGMPKIIKFFLSSLPELDYARDENNNLILENGKKVLERVPSSYFTDKVASPEKIMNILGNQLAGMTDIGDMVSRIKELAEDYPTLNGLISRMQLGDEILPATATFDEARFQTLFWQQFAKASHDYYLTYLSDDGNVSILDSTSETQQNVTKEGWRTNLIAQLNSPTGVVSIVDNKIVISKDKVQQLRAIEDPFKRAEKLGIEFRFPDKVRKDPILFKSFRENLDAIINSIVAAKFPVTDLYTRAGLNSQGRINTLASIEAATNPDSIERQHIGLDNKTLYSLTLNNSLSLGVGELNNKAGHWFESVRNSSYSQNSVVMERLLSDPNYKVGLAVNEGIKRQTADGEETAKLTPADALANVINGVVNGYYSILRPGDKKLEYKLKYGEFIEAKGLVNRDGNYNAKVNKIFRGYLQDEFNRVGALKAGYGTNIKEFNKHVLLPSGRVDLGIFNSILASINMPTINSAEDGAIWIENNKDVIDDAIKKFLESTTNQYGANARKLSVFKETLSKEKGKGFVGTGQYILNGIDDKVVNRVLGRDSDSDRYSKTDIHQFFRYIAVNQLIGNIEQTKTTTGSITFYKDPLKRFSALTGTKKVSRVDEAYESWMRANMPKEGYVGSKKFKLTQDGNIRIVTVGDLIVTTPQEQIDNFKEGLKANGLSKTQIDDYVKKLKGINEADAQSWMHLPAYRELLARAGDWTPAHEAAYAKAIKGQILTADEIFLFPPLKPQGYGPQMAKGNFSPLFIKTSVSPLIPSVVRGTDLEDLMIKMYRDDIDMVSTESAIKVGGKVGADGNFVPLYVNQNGIGKIDNTKFTDDVISILPAQYMGIQLDIAPIRKNVTTRGTQHEKIIMSNIVNIPEGESIVSEYKSTISKLVDLAKTELQNRLGIQSKGDDYIIPDRSKLLDYLTEQSIRRGVPTNTLIGLQEALTNGSTLDAVINKDRIDSILAAIITDGAIKTKRNGEQRVQVAIAGYGQRVYEGNQLQTSNKLAPYVYDKNGTKPMEVMIALPKALVPYVEKIGGLAAFNQAIADGKIDERILKGVGFRIPTQQLSSMVYYKVKEFLPYESGPVVVLPSVITTIAGSDFDIDKLSMYDKNYNIVGGISNDLRPNLRRELTKAGVIDQFRTIFRALPEQMSDEQINNLLHYIDYAPDSITDDELNKMEKIITDAQRKYIKSPSLKYIESDGNTKEALENKLLEINEQVLSHPHNFKNLVAPIGNEVLSGLANEMVRLRDSAEKGTFNEFETQEDVAYSSMQLMNMNYLLDQGQRFQAGKDLLGIAAKQNTHHILAQLSKLALRPDVKVWFSEAKDVPLRLDNVTDLAGKHQISDIISEFINGFVDIVKDQFVFDLNANKDTINPFFYLTRVGVPIESVTSFLNQPVIRKYIQEKARQNSLIAKGLPEAYRKTNYGIIQELREELYNMARKEQALYFKAKRFESLMPHYFQSTEARDDLRATYNNFTKEQLDKMILNPNTPANAYRQLQVLDMFLQYQEDANQLTNLMQLNSQDTDGVKKSLSRSFVESAMYKEFVNGDNIFTNAPDVVNNSLIKPYFDVVMSGESYFSSLFDSKSEKSNELRKQLVHQLASLGLDDTTDTLKKFENHIVAHLLQNVTTDNFPLSISDEAIKSKATKREDGTTNVQPPLLLGVDSTVNSLIKLRKQLANPNEFVNSLFGIRGTDRTQGNYVDTVKMFTKRINKQQADLLSGAATDLLNSNPELAKRIFRTTLIQSGLNNSYMSYHTLLPAKWFHNFVSSIMDVYRNQDVPTSNIIDDYYRNNWKNNNLVPSVQGKALAITGDIATMDVSNTQYRGKLYIKQWRLPEGVTFEQYRKAKLDESLPEEQKPKWELSLYKYSDNDGQKVYYTRVNPLGNGERYQETSLSPKVMSALNENNKTDNELPSSENYNIFTGYTPSNVEFDADSVEVNRELRDRLITTASMINNKVNIQMQLDNINKILSGNKTTTTRSDSQAKAIGLNIGEKGITYFGNNPFTITNRGRLTIEEAGGKEAMLNSEGVNSDSEFKYQQTRDWVNGKGTLNVYDISPYKDNIEVSEEKLTKSIKVYKESIASGMTEQQATERAEKEITCR